MEERQDRHEHAEREITEDQHVRKASRTELADEDAFAQLQGQGPAPDPASGVDPATAGEPNTSADLGSGGGSTTVDPGRKDPIVPGEGKL